MDSSVFIESKTMRDSYIGRFDVLEKVKHISYITHMSCTVKDASEYYEVPAKTIEKTIERNKAELESDGLHIVKGSDLKRLKEDLKLRQYVGSLRVSSLTLIPRRAMLRIGMLLRKSDVAKAVRDYLLNVEETATEEGKRRASMRLTSKHARLKLTDCIKEYIPESKSKKFAYANYTNLVYKYVFQKNASQLCKERFVSKKDLLRDTFTFEELKKVADVESEVATLLKYGQNYEGIDKMLQASYKNKSVSL